MRKESSKPLQLSIFNRYPTNYQSNLFTESRQEFSELEKKIVTLVVNQLGNLAVQGKIQPNLNVQVTVPFNELTRAHHDLIADAAESLSKKRLSYRDEEHGDFIFITPFPFVKSVMVGGRRCVEITMLANVVPHFAALGQRYTKYDLDVMLSLSSVYAQRMFEIVSMYYHVQKTRFTYSVDELRNILNCPTTYRYNDFKVNVLEVAQRELYQKASLILEWQPFRKEGKRIVELAFHIKTAQQLALEDIQQDQQIISQLAPHELLTLAYDVLAKYDLKPQQKDNVITDPEKLEILFRVHSELENGLRPGVNNRTRYMAKSLGLDQVKIVKTGKATIVSSSPVQLSLPAPPSAPRSPGEAQPISAFLRGITSEKETKKYQADS